MSTFMKARPALHVTVRSRLTPEPVQFSLDLLCTRMGEISSVRHAPVIDGNLSDWDMAGAQWIDDRSQVTLVPDRWTGPAEASGAFRLAMDDSLLYVAATVVDSNVIHATRREEPYQADAVTIYFDVRDSAQFQKRLFYKDVYALVFAPVSDKGEGPYAITVYPYGTTIARVRYASLRTKTGYTIEAAIPILELGPLAGRSAIGVDVVIDNLKLSGERVRMAWNGTWGDFMDASRYGLMKLTRSRESRSQGK